MKRSGSRHAMLHTSPHGGRVGAADGRQPHLGRGRFFFLMDGWIHCVRVERVVVHGGQMGWMDGRLHTEGSSVQTD